MCSHNLKMRATMRTNTGRRDIILVSFAAFLIVCLYHLTNVPKPEPNTGPKPVASIGREPKLADGCRHVYLDFGSNLGVQVRKLFEGNRYPGAKYVEHFDRLFGPLYERQKPGHVCAFGVEANPQHNRRLKHIEGCYNKFGWRTVFLAPRFVSNVDDTAVRFYVDNDDDTTENLGATMYRNKIWKYRDDRAVDVKTMDAGSFIMNEIVGRTIPNGYGEPSVFMKLDVEG